MMRVSRDRNRAGPSARIHNIFRRGLSARNALRRSAKRGCEAVTASNMVCEWLKGKGFARRLR